MNVFLVIASLMAAIAAAAVVWPLIRSHRRLEGGIAALLMLGLSAGLYPLWSNWNWNAAPVVAEAGPSNAGGANSGPDVSAMVAKLEKHLQEVPDDTKGWVMMGRSYLELQRFDDAVTAFGHAKQLDAKNVDAKLGLGEALSMRSGSQITPEAAKLFEEAMTLEPQNPRALLYGGFAAAVRGDVSLARTRWQTLKASHPPADLEKMLDARLAELASMPGGAPGAAKSASADAPANASASEAPASTSAVAEARVNISISPALKNRLKNGALLFVFARNPGGGGPPLAAKRLTIADIGTEVTLTAADSMMPGRAIAAGQQVQVMARVSFSGQPTPVAGDLYGELNYNVGVDKIRELVIDRIAE